MTWKDYIYWKKYIKEKIQTIKLNSLDFFYLKYELGIKL